MIYVLLLKDPERMERLHANLSGLIRLSCHLKDRHRRGDAIDWRREVEAISLDSRLAVGERQLREHDRGGISLTDMGAAVLARRSRSSVQRVRTAVPRAVHWRAVSEQIERECEAAAADRRTLSPGRGAGERDSSSRRTTRRCAGRKIFTGTRLTGEDDRPVRGCRGGDAIRAGELGCGSDRASSRPIRRAPSRRRTRRSRRGTARRTGPT